MSLTKFATDSWDRKTHGDCRIGRGQSVNLYLCKQSLLVTDAISNAKTNKNISRKKIILKCELQGSPVSINRITLKPELRALLMARW